MPFGPVDVSKQLPKTNCGECGHPSCLAFATQVVGFGYDLANCPHLDLRAREQLGAIVTAQRENGVLVKRPSHQITREHLREKITRCDFAASVRGLGAKYVREGEVETLRLLYFGR
jgi:Na+-translocating ferredoxin:NAD+ oxidoreductase RNF subunit RnfB